MPPQKQRQLARATVAMATDERASRADEEASPPATAGDKASMYIDLATPSQQQQQQEQRQQQQRQREWQGSALMFATAMLWGSNPVALRYLFTAAEPPHPAVLQTVQVSLAAVLLYCADDVRMAVKRARATAAAKRTVDAANDADLLRSDSSASGQQLLQQVAGLRSTNSGAAPSPPSATRLLSSGRLAGLELGCWMFVANLVLLMGFQSTPATRGAFLFRLSAVFTPILASLGGARIAGQVWRGCVIALLGSLLLATDRAASGEGELLQAAGASLGALTTGDALLVAAAVLWSLQTLRTGVHSARYDSLQLAKRQVAATAALSALWLGWECASAAAEGLPLESLWRGWRDPLAWAVLLWPAAGPWGAGMYMQLKAQQIGCSPSLTMIILATDPLWTAGFALLLGGEEASMGSRGLVGAAMILAASLIASRGSKLMH